MEPMTLALKLWDRLLEWGRLAFALEGADATEGDLDEEMWSSRDGWEVWENPFNPTMWV